MMKASTPRRLLTENRRARSGQRKGRKRRLIDNWRILQKTRAKEVLKTMRLVI